MLEVHRELLLDEIRVSAYREAIRRVVKAGDVVLDIGTGSGIRLIRRRGWPRLLVLRERDVHSAVRAAPRAGEITVD